MLKEKMYVRCPIDNDYKNPRDFLMGQIVEIDEFADTVKVVFNDPFNFRGYYDSFPPKAELPLGTVERCKFFKESIVIYANKEHRVITSEKTEDYNNYYLQSEEDKSIKKVSEADIIAPFTIGKIDPSKQLARYEFQNPCWFFGRSIVSKTMNVLENSIYGFEELAGCKIFLLPHQLKSIMRCLQSNQCRYMLADEVGMGKTIEAASILKIYLSGKTEARVLIAVPKPLKEQWRTELFLKFDLLDGRNENDNYIALKSTDEISDRDILDGWDFTIVDEAHKLLFERQKYNKFHQLSKNTKNLLLLSATPVQQKRENYLDLLRLILPEKYDLCSQNDFDVLVDKQNTITKSAAVVLLNIEDYMETIKDIVREGKNPHDNEDCAELFEEIKSGISKLDKIVGDLKFTELINQVSFNEEDMGLNGIQIAMSYLCDNYQIERNIIRNRRRYLEDLPERNVIELKYKLDPDKNLYEYATYHALVDWISREDISEELFNRKFKPLLTSCFSSVWAFLAEIERQQVEGEIIAEGVISNAEQWKIVDNEIVENIMDTLDDPEKNSSRIINIIYYLDEYIGDKKVVLFTNYKETFDVYEKLLTDYFTEDGFCCFNKEMDLDELELNVYRFQNEKNCTIMLCDESGGEGRNFQCADYVVHIDLPWDANAIEQRIGRLDRLGRTKERPVTSIVAYAEESLEEELFKFWNTGLKIFSHSLSGLEIIMSKINKEIVAAIITDFKFGLSNAIHTIIEETETTEQWVREEQHFDTAAYLYRPMNQELIRLVKYYNENENQLFSDTMLTWSQLAGFRGHIEKENTATFSEDSFSAPSAKNSLLIPPNWKKYFDKKQYVFENKIRSMYEEKKKINVNRNIRSIQGTFRRKLAIENDYLHFFAPGDDIFDCIVDNAMKSSRGQSASFAFVAPFDWKGLIFTWSLAPNEKLLIENNIPLYALSHFRNYMAVDQMVIPVAFNGYGNIAEQQILRELDRIIKNGYEDNKSEITHLGQRKIASSFLNINMKYNVSNLEWFKGEHVPEQWPTTVKRGRENSLKIAKSRFMKLSHIDEAQEEVNRILNSVVATAQYYGREPENHDELIKMYELIMESIKKPIITLESACYVWMVKS